MDEQTQATTQATTQETASTKTQEGSAPTLEDRMATIRLAAANLQRTVDQAEAGDPPVASGDASIQVLTERVAAVEKDLADFKQQLHDAGIRLVS